MSPTRGAQGNALKTIVTMPFVLDEEMGKIEIAAHGERHRIVFKVDRIRQAPVIEREVVRDTVKTGTEVRVLWPDFSMLNPEGREGSFFTNCRRLHLAEPEPDADRRLARQAQDRGGGDHRRVAEMGTV